MGYVQQEIWSKESRMRSNFGKNLEIVQALRGISNTALAKRMDLSKVTISMHRKGTAMPSLKTISKYAIALGVRPGLLIDAGLSEKLEKGLE